MVRVAIMMALVVLVSAGAPSSVSPAQSQVDEVSAAQTATELSYLESIGDYNGLYDRIHPDAHAVIPRAAVIGWYQNEFAPLGPGVATVTGVRFVQWTWPVTGVTYPAAAEVSFVQPFANGTVLEDVVRLVRDGSGEWRWFFGRSREFVDAQIARYVPSAPATGGLSMIDVVASDLNAYWGISFSAAGRHYVPPTLAQLAPGTVTGCGYIGQDPGPAMYCGSDMTIYVDLAWFGLFEEEIGDFAWITILAHEFGHHVQLLDGVVPGPGPRFELQADCLAGSYARDAETRGLLDPGDVTEAVAISAISGDAPWLPRDEYGAHGTGDERVAAFMRGYLDGFIGCGFLSSVRGSTTVIVPQPASATTDIADLLPLQHEVPPGLFHAGDSQRTLTQVTVNYSDPVEAERLFRSWGWSGNVTRTYEGSGTGNGPTSVYVSVHRLGTDGDAAAALDYSLADQARATGAWEIDVPSLADTTRALQSSGDVTIYAQRADVMIRLTVAGPADTSLLVAETLMRAILSRAG
jgi:uncharacterized protein